VHDRAPVVVQNFRVFWTVVALKPVNGLPPFDDGAVQDTVAVVLPVVTVTPVGAEGATAFGVTSAEATEGAPVPFELVAVTSSE